jgi:hypothetical protein
MDLSDFCCFQYRQWNRLTNRTKLNSLDEIGLHAELSYFHYMYTVGEIGLYAVLSYFHCIYTVGEIGLHS